MRGNVRRSAIFSLSGPMPERRDTAIMGVIALRRICLRPVLVRGSVTGIHVLNERATLYIRRGGASPILRSVSQPEQETAQVGSLAALRPEQALDLSVALRVSVHGSLHVTRAKRAAAKRLSENS